MVKVREYENFEDYLRWEHAEGYTGTDDDMSDAFEAWVSGLDGAEYIMYADQYVAALEQKKQVSEFVEDFGKEHDPVNHPKHYCSHPSGIECINVVKHNNFCIGNAIKYLWRYEDKANPIQDLEKAMWYINEQIKLLNNK